MRLTELSSIISIAQQKTLSGGITCRHLSIHDNGKRELIVSGEVTITIKVLELTTHGASQLHRLMNATQAIISNKINGASGLTYGVFLHKYDSTKKTFTNDYENYTVGYNLHYIVKLVQITMLSQLSGNDFALAVVDEIGLKTDNSFTGGLTIHGGGPSSVVYKEWLKFPYLGAHEFFHALKLSDIKDKSLSKNLMYEYAGKNRTDITDNQRLTMNRYIIRALDDMYSAPYSNPNLNTSANLRTFLNTSKNGFKYNKAKFR